MKAFGLVLLLVSGALSAPQGEVDGREAKEVKARQIYSQGEPIFLQASAPQFGAKLSQGVPQGAQVVYLQGGYQQPQYYTSGQQLAYVSSPPAQTYVSSAPTRTFVSSAPSQTFYSGASTQYVQPQTNLLTVQKTVKPAVYKTSQVSYRPPIVSTFKAQAPPAFATYKAPLPAPAPPPHVVRVSAPAPAPAPAVIKSAAPPPSQYSFNAEPNHVIVKQVQDDSFDGSFTYSFETDHGIVVESSGYLKNAGSEDEVQVIQGSYTYYSPEGVPITTTYIADENGFQVQGDHLPVPPPLPEAIAKSIEYQRSLPPSVEDLEAARQQ